MPSNWNAETYRARARQWRTQAETLPSGRDRDGCMELAHSYANLAAIIDRLQDNTSVLPGMAFRPDDTSTATKLTRSARITASLPATTA